MKPIPKKINVLGLEYEVIKEKEYMEDEDGIFYGYIFHKNKKIYIYGTKYLSLYAQWQTLMHEVFHAIESSALDRPMKEKDLNVFSQILLDTLVRNGWMEGEK